MFLPHCNVNNEISDNSQPFKIASPKAIPLYNIPKNYC